MTRSPAGPCRRLVRFWPGDAIEKNSTIRGEILPRFSISAVEDTAGALPAQLGNTSDHGVIRLLDLPDAARAVAAAGGEKRPVVVEGDDVDGELVPQIRPQQFARFGVPQFDDAVVAAGGELRAVGRIRASPDVSFVSHPRLDELAAHRVPDADRLVPAD